jgi:hypothetical protein
VKVRIDSVLESYVVNSLALCRIAIHSEVLKVDIIDHALLGRSRADKSSKEGGDVDDSDGLHIERLGKTGVTRFRVFELLLHEWFLNVADAVGDWGNSCPGRWSLL